MKTVQIIPILGDGRCLQVNLINTLGVCVAQYKYWNYIDNGDSLALCCDNWVNYGLFPDVGRGLVKIS